MPSPSAQRSFSFGLFELDVARGELRKQGRVIKLQDQPFQVLDVLVRRPGEVVTREELQQAVWPADTFVEFDQGLNTAIKKIRLALGDSAENPRFVETIPRKGYRFIAPIERIATDEIGPNRIRSPVLAALLVGIPAVAGAGVWALRPKHTDETAPVPLPFTSYPGAEVSPSFSPDGNYVTFAWRDEAQHASNFDIFVKPITGRGDPVRLTHGPAHNFSPVWSPDGRFIAFLRRLSPIRSAVFIARPIGGMEQKVAEKHAEATEHWAGPQLSWSPDSKWLILPDKDKVNSPSALYRLSMARARGNW